MWQSHFLLNFNLISKEISDFKSPNCDSAMNFSYYSETFLYIIKSDHVPKRFVVILFLLNSIINAIFVE